MVKKDMRGVKYSFLHPIGNKVKLVSSKVCRINQIKLKRQLRRDKFISILSEAQLAPAIFAVRFNSLPCCHFVLTIVAVEVTIGCPSLLKCRNK